MNLTKSKDVVCKRGYLEKHENLLYATYTLASKLLYNFSTRAMPLALLGGGCKVYMNSRSWVKAKSILLKISFLVFSFLDDV